MHRYKIACTAGIAMFAMFFGSGNLVFPLIIGMKSNDQYLIASLGLMLTGVLVPFLGLFSMVLYQGNKEAYFGLLGKYAPLTLSLLMLSLIGPFGVIPRCILVTYGGISLVYPQIPLFLFSAIFVLLILLIIWQKSKIVPIIGKFLGPLKITGLILIIIAAIKQSPQLIASQQIEAPFVLGIMEGYHTMDLLAAFFFSITIIEYLGSICTSKEETIRVSLFASTIGASLIAIVYVGLVILGAYYAPQLIDAKPEQYLTIIAQLTLGEHAAFILAVTIFLSCLATAASLARLFATFLQTDIAKEKISWLVAMIITIAISFALSLIGFKAISSILGQILTYLYPALITLTISAIAVKVYAFKWPKQTFWLTLSMTIIYKFFN